MCLQQTFAFLLFSLIKIPPGRSCFQRRALACLCDQTCLPRAPRDFFYVFVTAQELICEWKLYPADVSSLPAAYNKILRHLLNWSVPALPPPPSYLSERE